MIPTPVANKVDVWILAGQSNMVGENGEVRAPNIPKADLPASYKALIAKNPGKIIQYSMHQKYVEYVGSPNNIPYTGEWFDAEPNVAIKGYGVELIDYESVGPDMSFATTLLNKGISSKIGFIPTAWGGTSILAWAPVYDTPILYKTMYDTSIRALNKLGDKANLKGMIWIQGESDGGPDWESYGMNPPQPDQGKQAKQYASNLEALVKNVRKDFKNYNACLPVIVVKMALNGRREYWPNLNIVRQAQIDFPKTHANIISSEMEGKEFFPQDYSWAVQYVQKGTTNLVHLTKKGAIDIGVEMANDYINALPTLQNSCN